MAIRVIDSHIHLWNANTANPQGHDWMKADSPLAKPYLLADYLSASSKSRALDVEKLIYIETAACCDPPSEDLSAWTHGPLNEIRFLRETFSNDARQVLAAAVLWAPMNQPPAVLEEWLLLAAQTAGTELWDKVRGFRFLVQWITDRPEFEDLVCSDYFIANLKLLGERGYTFDVGIDQRLGGIWQLRTFLSTIRRVHADVSEQDKTTFILNHFCKPDYSAGFAFEAWSEVMIGFSKQSKTYMKLSGAFSELPSSLNTAGAIVKHIRPWNDHILKCFGPERIMFGSDWPVCNAGCPAGSGAWSMWAEIVSDLLSSLPKSAHDQILRQTALTAYGIDKGD